MFKTVYVVHIKLNRKLQIHISEAFCMIKHVIKEPTGVYTVILKLMVGKILTIGLMQKIFATPKGNVCVHLGKHIIIFNTGVYILCLQFIN